MPPARSLADEGEVPDQFPVYSMEAKDGLGVQGAACGTGFPLFEEGRSFSNPTGELLLGKLED